MREASQQGREQRRILLPHQRVGVSSSPLLPPQTAVLSRFLPEDKTHFFLMKHLLYLETRRRKISTDNEKCTLHFKQKLVGFKVVPVLLRSQTSYSTVLRDDDV